MTFIDFLHFLNGTADKKRTKNKRLLKLYKRLEELTFPDIDAESKRFYNMITDLILVDNGIGKAMDTYINYETYGKGHPLESIKSELKELDIIEKKIKENTPSEKDQERHRLILIYISDLRKIAVQALKEDR